MRLPTRHCSGPDPVRVGPARSGVPAASVVWLQRETGLRIDNRIRPEASRGVACVGGGGKNVCRMMAAGRATRPAVA